jgi:hypothetical protein
MAGGNGCGDANEQAEARAKNGAPDLWWLGNRVKTDPLVGTQKLGYESDPTLLLQATSQGHNLG